MKIVMDTTLLLHVPQRRRVTEKTKEFLCVLSDSVAKKNFCKRSNKDLGETNVFCNFNIKTGKAL